MPNDRRVGLLGASHWHPRLLAGAAPSREPGPRLPVRVNLANGEERKLVHRLFLSSANAPRTVVFSSVESGNGCSTLCSRTAVGLATRVSGSVCVVDANLRAPSLHRLFDADNSRGLTDAAFQREPIRNFARHLPKQKVWLLPCGETPDEIRFPISRYRLESVMAELCSSFRHVLVNAPMVSPYRDATVLGQLAWGLRDVSLSGSFPGVHSESLRPDLSHADEGELLQRLFLDPRPDPLRAVLFSDRGSVEECGRFCVRAAQTLARRAVGSVCLVDANLRSPSLHRAFGVDNSKGLLQAVFRGDPAPSYAQRLSLKNLWLVPVGSLSGGFHSGAGWNRLKSVMYELCAAFDYVLIDAPPINPYPDIALLGQVAEGVVMVIEANSTRREAARRAKKTLEAAGLPILAGVLNKRTFPVPRPIYDGLLKGFPGK